MRAEEKKEEEEDPSLVGLSSAEAFIHRFILPHFASSSLAEDGNNKEE